MYRYEITLSRSDCGGVDYYCMAHNTSFVNLQLADTLAVPDTGYRVTGDDTFVPSHTHARLRCPL